MELELEFNAAMYESPGIENVSNYLQSKYDLFTENVLESSFDKVDENKEYKVSDFSQVYVVLFKGTHLGARIITLTGDYFYHTAISFTTGMNSCYTFTMGRNVKGEVKVGNKMYNFGKSSAGLSIQNIRSGEFKKQSGEIMAVFVTKNEKEKLYERLRFFLENAQKMKYNIPNFLKIITRIPDKNPNARICSSFVADILNAGDSQRTKLSNSRNRPQDLQAVTDCFPVWTGVFGNYNEKELIRNTENMKKKYVGILNEK